MDNNVYTKENDESEKWGYKIGDKLIREYASTENICAVSGFTQNYVKVNNGDLFSPEGSHYARGCCHNIYKTYYEKASDDDILRIRKNNKKAKIVNSINDMEFSSMYLEELEKLYDAIPEKYKGNKNGIN
jgi:hypothetical protein